MKQVLSLKQLTVVVHGQWHVLLDMVSGMCFWMDGCVAVRFDPDKAEKYRLTVQSRGLLYLTVSSRPLLAPAQMYDHSPE